MEKTSRKENKLLNRVEIGFQWKHDGKSTPSRKEVMDLVATLEPGSKTDLIVVKDCKTRFGQPLTTGMAFIYGDEESMKVEPEYIHKRHESFRSSSAKEETPAKAEVPEAPQETEESAESNEEDGGEQ
ncbi:MAG: 30S ribosomal protein S24e [Euryarchaeota archaeon TMED248]|nr:30S ribosomal protein S24e [Euryarchaeota archaeon]RPG77023.1 MAG: 30S ribosomal protein S24e [Euryarchaeota archaeon TMED248]|tara:strand:+ start:1645 stop:2028 length:384 start_codon:yes stop_codon:yes gene_type:complete